MSGNGSLLLHKNLKSRSKSTTRFKYNFTRFNRSTNNMLLCTDNGLVFEYISCGALRVHGRAPRILDGYDKNYINIIPLSGPEKEIAEKSGFII
jgi:hypothetical protein